MDRVKVRRTRSLTVREIAEQEKLRKELEEESKKNQRRIEIINRREKVKKFGRITKRKSKPKGIPKNLKSGDCVLIKHGIGIVRYIGPVEGAKRKDQIYAGIELQENEAKGLNDGCAFGNRYFQCEAKQGVFVRNVPKILPPEKILFQLGKLSADLKQMSLEQLKLHEEVARLDQENEDLHTKFKTTKEKADELETQLSNRSTLQDDKKLSIDDNKQDDKKLSIDENKQDVPANALNRHRGSVHTNNAKENLARKKKALFRVASGDLWSENDVLDYEKQLQKELERGQREQALMALDLPDFNAPDGDFVQWLTQRFQQFQKLESQFQVPDIKDPKVKRAILVVTRMLASFTQQINRNNASNKNISKSLLSTLDARIDEESESYSSSYDDSSEDF